MTAVSAQYTREIRGALGYSATWLPSVDIRIGDVGVISDYQYRRVSSLADFGIGFTTRKDDSRAVIQYSTENAVSIGVDGAADAGVLGNTPLEGRLSVKFGAGNAVLFQAGNCRTQAIEDQHGLGRQVLEMADRGDWPEGYVVVTDVVTADVTTVLISNGSGAEAEFSLDADVELQSTSLVNAKAQVRLLHAKNIGTQIVAQRGLTPLFKAQGVVRHLIRRRSFGPQRGVSEPARQFAGVDYEDYA